MKKLPVLILIVFVLSSCAVKRTGNISSAENQDPLLLSVLWFQKSAEMKALYYQGYNIAKRSLAQKLITSPGNKLKAVIMDIDETILDNSPSEAYQILNNVPFTDQLWKEWVKKASAEPCPGALEFTKFADSLNVEVFYVTNRKMPDEYNPTIQNLNRFGFPFIDSNHLVLKTDESSKETRRIEIAEKYDILMLIGDNMADFDAVFDKRGEDLSFGAVEENKNKFGSEFIVLPNPMYGPWINAALKDKQGENTREKMLKSLKSF
jgi:5'-nucleotidase (lipoprotein e(P4) family)